MNYFCEFAEEQAGVGGGDVCTHLRLRRLHCIRSKEELMSTADRYIFIYILM